MARGQGLCLFPSGLETRLGQTQGEGEEARGLRPGKAECEAALRGLLVGKGQGGGGKALSESWGQDCIGAVVLEAWRVFVSFYGVERGEHQIWFKGRLLGTLGFVFSPHHLISSSCNLKEQAGRYRI